MRQLCEQLRIPDELQSCFVRATDPVGIITERGDVRNMETAIWLLLEPHIPQAFHVQQIDKPSRYKPIDETRLIGRDETQ